MSSPEFITQLQFCSPTLAIVGVPGVVPPKKLANIRRVLLLAGVLGESGVDGVLWVGLEDRFV